MDSVPGGDSSQKRGSAHSPLSLGVVVCGLPRPLGRPSLFFEKLVKDLSVELHLRAFKIIVPYSPLGRERCHVQVIDSPEPDVQ